MYALATEPEFELDLEPVRRMGRDLRRAAATLTDQQARYLVDTYYQIQEFRKAGANERRATVEAAEPNECVDWIAATMHVTEQTIKSALDAYTDRQPVGQWAKSIVGIGPVISAGLLAHIDITKAPTAGHIWRFAGLDPTSQWGKGEKRPWNAQLKVLCWKIGQSFIKVQNHREDVYGHVFVIRKEQEKARNDAGMFQVQASDTLAHKRIGHDTEAYKWYSQGKLPPAHINARAQRYAAKLFLAHLHEVWYFTEYQRLAPKPYVVEHLGHVHAIGAPNAHLVPGLSEARAHRG